MAYTYDDFLNAANASGMLTKISESDLNLAKQYPEFGLSILSLTKDLDSATTAEQKLLATEAAEQLRSAYSGGVVQTDTQINDLLQQAANYGSFNYGKETEYQRLLNSVANPQEFSYDLDSDVVWDSYRKQYLREGERATADTLAKVSAATGGRPSSYAISAAHQAGDYYASKLTDMIPTLFQNAYQRYLNDLELEQSSLAALAADRETAYDQHITEYATLLDALEKLIEQAADSGDVNGGNDSVTVPSFVTATEESRKRAAGTENYNRFQSAIRGTMPTLGTGSGSSQPSSDLDDLAVNSSFTGSSYPEAIQYMRTQGIRSDLLQGVMTEEEWNKAKADGSAPSETSYDTYTEYIDSYIKYALYMTNKSPLGHSVTTSVSGVSTQ